MVLYREYVNNLSTRRVYAPSKPQRFGSAGGFIGATTALRKLAIANFSTKLARLNHIMEHLRGDTHVKTLQRWRDAGREAEFVQALTRGIGEPESTTAKELILYLCEGSPAARLCFQEVLAAKSLEKLDEARWKQHQKLISADSTPPCAWYLEVLLRAALIDGRVMHAGLSNRAKSELCDLFNKAESTLKVLIMMYDVGAVGLNLHVACDRVLALAIPRSEGQSAQVAGRANRVSNFQLLSMKLKSTFGLRC
jgi:hypothetical protein